MDIEGLIKEGNAVLCCEKYEEAKYAWDMWCVKLRNLMAEGCLTAAQFQNLKVKMHFVENEYSQIENRKALRRTTGDIVLFLQTISKESYNGMQEKYELGTIEKVLENFYLYLHAMYQATVHGNGTLKQESLKQIKIGNEYDAQRMLYALLLPMFPTLRMEVNGDNGYSGMRADIYLEKYDLIIEVKCTRSTMTEKKLTEELGADAFHYHAKNLFIFIYDKDGMINNAEADKAAFYRTREENGKNVTMFITQPVQL